MELGDDGYPLNPANTLLITGWDGVVLDYETNIAANPGLGQWLVTAELANTTVVQLVQGTPAADTGQPLTILTSSVLPTAMQSVAYSAGIFAIGGSPPYTWSVVSGTTPPGLGLGTFGISGTPTTPGSYGFRLRVTGTDSQFVEKDFTLQVNSVVIVPPGEPQGAHIGTAAAGGMSGLVSRNTIAFDPIHKVYLAIVNRPPVTGRFLDEHGVQIGSDFVIATEPGAFTAWASIAFGGPPNDPVFLVTYVVGDQVNNPKFGRLVRYGPGGASVGPAVFIANVASEWGHSEKAQNVWSGQNFIVGTRMPTGGPLPTFQVQTFDLNGGVSAPVNLGDGADYYGSPALACSTANVNTCMAVGFMAGYYAGFSGGSYGRLFDATTLAPTTSVFYLATGTANEDQQVVYQAHTGRFLTEWLRGAAGGVIDTRLVDVDGSMSILDLARGFAGPGAGCNTICYNAATHTTLLGTKSGGAAELFVMELGDDGYPLNPANTLLITGWDGVVLDYETSIAANPGLGQWLVTAELANTTVFQIVQGTVAAASAPLPVQNNGFSSGLTGWNVFGGPGGNVTMNATVTGGVLEFYRTTNVGSADNSAAILQPTGAAVPANTGIRAQFDLGNSSPSRKRVAVLLHDLDFSDLQVCSFWVEAGAPLRTYVMRMHTTKAWANATVSFYAASEGGAGGGYQLDNVSIALDPTLPLDRTDCVDPIAPSPVPSADGPELLTNGAFSANLSGWSLFGQIIAQATGGVAYFVRPPGTPAGALLQPSGTATAARTAITARFDMANTSPVRKRVTAILHDLDFSDLQVCTFWLDPNQPPTSYTMITFAGQAWANTTISFYMGNVDQTPWVALDNVSLRWTPSAVVLGTQCLVGAAGNGAAAMQQSMPPPGTGSPAMTTTSTGSSATTGTASTTATTTSNKTPAGVMNLDGGQVWMIGGGAPATLVWNAPIDLRQATAPYLRFQSFVQATSSVAEVQVSLDGAEWTAVGEVPTGDGWLTADVDLGAYAGQAIYLRFVLRPTAIDAPVDQWFMTDVWIGFTGLPPR